MNELRPQPDCKGYSGRKGYWLLAGLTGGLLALCAFFDLQIAHAAFQPESEFGHFLHKFGECPGHALILYSAGVYLLLGRHLIIRLLMILPFCLEIWIFVAKHPPIHSFSEGALVSFLVLFPLAIILYTRRFTTNAEMSRSAALVVLAGVLHPIILVQILKKLWGRVRFDDLVEGETQFTPWYLPQGFTDHHSFPSGHTAMGILACFLVLYFPSHLRKLAFLPLFAWAMAVAASRVILGAHYVSDVIFSLFIGLTLLLCFSQLSGDKNAPDQSRS